MAQKTTLSNGSEKSIDVCGLGNGLLDILVDLTEAEFQALGLERGSMRLIDSAVQAQLLAKFSGKTKRETAGGSVANSIIAVQQLGSQGAFLTSLGDDKNGRVYFEEFRALGAVIDDSFNKGTPTGTCVSMVTPDSERTMQTCLGAADELGTSNIKEEFIARARWLFIEGYPFANPKGGPAAIKQAVQYAKQHNTKIALTLSEPWVVQSFRPLIDEILVDVDMVFANAEEAAALAGTRDASSAFRELGKRFSNLVVTRGPDGALLKVGNETAEVAAFRCEPRDLTGAGDMFAGTFLHALGLPMPLSERGERACYLAKQVITRVGARLREGARQHWDAFSPQGGQSVGGATAAQAR